jgi:hypothetical protein
MAMMDDSILLYICSRKLSIAKINYEIHDKELLAIIDTFEEWRHLFEEAQHTTTVYMDHKNLEYFMNTQVLNRRQTRWSISLSRFDFVIIYVQPTFRGSPMPSCDDLIWHQKREIQF